MFDIFSKKLNPQLSPCKKEEVCVGMVNDKDIYDFISVSAHQLKTPFSSVKWSLEFLMNNEVKTEDEKQILYKKMYESTKHALRLVDEMLNAYKLESSSAVFDFEAGDDLIDLLVREVDEIRKLAEVKNIKLVLPTIGHVIPDIYIDHAKMQDVFQIILENALRYTPNGGSVHIIYDTQPEGVLLSFADSGIGISKENQINIFHKFYRAPEAVKSEHQGSGLGLFIAKEIVERHRGKIWFESQVGSGTTFFIFLPFGKQK
ncbi:MAG: HAMP domain-containing sensor histidine kinase [bacterium]